jgi:hypothetical protein
LDKANFDLHNTAIIGKWELVELRSKAGGGKVLGYRMGNIDTRFIRFLNQCPKWLAMSTQLIAKAMGLVQPPDNESAAPSIALEIGRSS